MFASARKYLTYEEYFRQYKEKSESAVNLSGMMLLFCYKCETVW